ncbi:MAG: 3-deoxy-D-manno-octulosonate 8-phosphate phosphatase (KDO 8-P phosphatase) [bacterium]|nr:MAG: 3-deoxy-D-manno-octulosonate 8-phosphate phosphatase (KDO 8-P phosphatase) [bacterium]
MKACGLAIAVGDAVTEVKNVAHHVTVRNGGRGAVREAVEWLLAREGRWEETLARFLSTSDFVIRKDPGSR